MVLKLNNLFSTVNEGFELVLSHVLISYERTFCFIIKLFFNYNGDKETSEKHIHKPIFIATYNYFAEFTTSYFLKDGKMNILL